MAFSRLMAGFFVVGLGAAAGACDRETAPASAAATSGTPATESQVLKQLRADWQAQKETMIKIADAMPEAKFGYKSTPPQRNYGEQVMHVATSNVELLRMLGGTAAPPSFTVETAKTKADMLKALGESYDYGTALLNGESEASITQPIKDSPAWLGPASHARIIWTLLAHTMDIYGQMAVYLRLNGIVPPASRGV